MAETDIAKDLEARIAELQNQMESITKTLADQGLDVLGDVQHGAKKAVKTIKRKAEDVADEAQDEFHAVTQVAKENPAVTATIIAGVALAGLAVGIVLGGNGGSSRRW